MLVSGSSCNCKAIAYINQISDWSSGAGILASMGVPGYSNSHSYTHVIFTFWLSNSGAFDVLKVWTDPVTYMGQTFVDSITNNVGTVAAFQTAVKAMYNNAGIKIMASAFGATDHPIAS